MSTGKLMEVDGADVKARSSLQGTRQRIFVRDAQREEGASGADGDVNILLRDIGKL
jgi:hypothetical protein